MFGTLAWLYIAIKDNCIHMYTLYVLTYLYVFTSRCKSVAIALNYKHANRMLLVFLCFIRIEPSDTPTNLLIVFQIYICWRGVCICYIAILCRIISARDTFIVLPLCKSYRKLFMHCFLLFSMLLGFICVSYFFSISSCSIWISIWISTRSWINNWLGISENLTVCCLAILIENLWLHNWLNGQ